MPTSIKNMVRQYPNMAGAKVGMKQFEMPRKTERRSFMQGSNMRTKQRMTRQLGRGSG